MTFTLRNQANFFAQDNSRSGVCTLGNVATFFGVEGLKEEHITMTARVHGPGIASLMCQVNNTSAAQSSVFAQQIQFSAIKTN